MNKKIVLKCLIKILKVFSVILFERIDIFMNCVFENSYCYRYICIIVLIIDGFNFLKFLVLMNGFLKRCNIFLVRIRKIGKKILLSFVLKNSLIK